MGDPVNKKDYDDQLIAYKAELNHARDGIWSFMDDTPKLNENIDLDAYFHQRNQDANIVVITGIISKFHNKAGYDAFSKDNPHYEAMGWGDEYDANKHSLYISTYKHINLSPLNNDEGVKHKDYWSSGNQKFLQDFVTIARNDQNLSSAQKSLLKQAERALLMNTDIIPVIENGYETLDPLPAYDEVQIDYSVTPDVQAQSVPNKSSDNNGNAPVRSSSAPSTVPPVQRSNYPTQDGTAAPANTKTHTPSEASAEATDKDVADDAHDTTDGAPEKPVLHETVDDLSAKIKAQQAQINKDRDLSIRNRIVQLRTRLGRDNGQLNDDIKTSKLYDFEKQGIAQTVEQLHQERSQNGTKSYLLIDRNNNAYSIAANGDVFEWSERTDPKVSAFETTPSGNILDLGLAGGGAPKATMAASALLFKASGLDPNDAENNTAALQYKKAMLLKIRDNQDAFLKEKGIGDVKRQAILDNLHGMKFFNEDVFGVDTDREIINDNFKQNLRKNGIDDVGDTALILIALERYYRTQDAYADYTGMYHDDTFDKNINLAIMSDIVAGAATGKTPDSLADLNIKYPSPPNVADQYFTKQFHDIVDKNGGNIPDSVDGALLHESLVGQTLSRQEVKEFAKEMIVADAAQHGIPADDVSEAMYAGKFCPPVEYLRWAHQAGGSTPHEQNTQWNKTFGGLNDINGTIHTMVGKQMHDVTTKDLAAHQFMRMMPALYDGDFPALESARKNGTYMSYEDIQNTLKDSPAQLAVFEREINNTMQNQSIITQVVYNTGTEHYDFRKSYNTMRNDVYLPAEARAKNVAGKNQEFLNNATTVTSDAPALPAAPSVPILGASTPDPATVPIPASTTDTPPPTTTTPAIQAPSRPPW